MENEQKSITKAVSLRELKNMKFSAEVQLLGLMFIARSIGMMFGPRGSGKSLLAMIIAYATAAAKKVHPWGEGTGNLVCYLDGEMRIRGFQERIRQLSAFNGDPDSVSMGADNFHVISRDLAAQPIGNIDTESGQREIDALIPLDTKILIIDNLAAWTENGGEGTSWQSIKHWLLGKRLSGMAVLMLHHAGKSGAQRGTSAHEDLLDYSIRITPVPDEDPAKTVFDVDHTKLRDHLPQLRGSFRFTVYSENGVMKFDSVSVQSPRDEKLEEIEKLHKLGKTNTEIAAIVGRHKSTIGRALDTIKAAKAGGLVADESEGA